MPVKARQGGTGRVRGGRPGAQQGGGSAPGTPTGDSGPSFTADFTAISSLPTGISFSRATGGTRFNSSGVLVTEAVDAPRFDYAWNGSAWVAVGLLIEEQRTNLLKSSAGIGGTNWDLFGLSSVTLNSTDFTSPDGGTNYSKFVNTGSSKDIAYQNVATTAAQSYSYSYYFKSGTCPWIAFDDPGGTSAAWVNATTGAVGTVNSGSVNVVALGGGVFRAIYMNTATGTSTPGGVCPCNANATSNNTSGQTLYAWGAQFEIGAFATSHIPTTSAAVTRSADISQLAGSALTAFQGAASSVIMEVDGVPTTYGTILNDPTGGVTLLLRNGSSATQLFTQANSVTVVASVADTQAIFRVGLSRDSGGVSLVGNGGTVATDATAALSLAGANIQIAGRVSDGSYLNKHVRSIAIYSSRLSDATLQTKSVVGATF